MSCFSLSTFFSTEKIIEEEKTVDAFLILLQTPVRDEVTCVRKVMARRFLRSVSQLLIE